MINWSNSSGWNRKGRSYPEQNARPWDRPFPESKNRSANRRERYRLIAFTTVLSKTRAESFPLNSMRFRWKEPSASCE